MYLSRDGSLLPSIAKVIMTPQNLCQEKEIYGTVKDWIRAKSVPGKKIQFCIRAKSVPGKKIQFCVRAKSVP
jgi:hypothetical protein